MPNQTKLLEILLKNRNITDPLKEKFLNPRYEDLYDPFLLKDMEKSVVRIFEAIEGGEKIVIYSDYDCDGIPAAVIMHDFFKKIGYENFSIYIPHRHDEGYGLHADAIDEFIGDGVKLLITFDLGITAVSEVAKSQSAGIDVIITDHHLPQEEAPRAFAIINPKQEGCDYPEKNLCGAGLAFKLVSALIKKYSEYFKITDGWEKWLLDMVAVATLSDQVKLVDENRVLAYYGLKVLRKTKRPGLVEIFRKADVNPLNISEEDITFTLAPRLNAASRMDDPRISFEILATSDSVLARSLSDHLAKINNDRKTTVAHIMKDVKKVLDKRQDKPVIIIGNPAWRVGVLGLVASKVAEEYKKPAFIWGSEGSETIRGSCRGWGSANLVEVMSLLPKESLLSYGGHVSAGGFSVSHQEIHFLEERLIKVFDGITDEKIEEDFNIEAVISVEDVTFENYKVIEMLAPYGEGNPKPTFLFKDIPIKSIKEFGKDKNHLELTFFKGGDREIKAISFFKTRDSFGRSLTAGERIDLTATFEKNTFMGKNELRLRIVDIM